MPPVDIAMSGAVAPTELRRRRRLTGLAVCVPCWVIVAIAVWLAPSARGYNTHTQLGLSPCALPAQTGWPCPTCGMTTAFAHMAHAQPLRAFRAQAFGAALFVATVIAACAGTVQAASGWRVFGRVRGRPWWGVVVLAAFFAAWALKLWMSQS